MGKKSITPTQKHTEKTTTTDVVPLKASENQVIADKLDMAVVVEFDENLNLFCSLKMKWSC